MYIIEIIPLSDIQRNQKKILSFYHAESLPAGSLVEVTVRGKKAKGVVINSQNIKCLKIRLKKEVDFYLKPVNKVLSKNIDQAFDITGLFPASDPLAKVKRPTKEKETSSKNLSNVSRRRLDTFDILDNYLERLAERKAVSRAKNYMQETAEKYLPYIDWENEAFEEEMRLFWVSASNYYRGHTHHDFVKILEWVKRKNCLNPKQVAKLFNKE